MDGGGSVMSSCVMHCGGFGSVMVVLGVTHGSGFGSVIQVTQG